jgi:hypothetical protein
MYRCLPTASPKQAHLQPLLVLTIHALPRIFLVGSLKPSWWGGVYGCGWGGMTPRPVLYSSSSSSSSNGRYYIPTCCRIVLALVYNQSYRWHTCRPSFFWLLDFWSIPYAACACHQTEHHMTFSSFQARCRFSTVSPCTMSLPLAAAICLDLHLPQIFSCAHSPPCVGGLDGLSSRAPAQV